MKVLLDVLANVLWFIFGGIVFGGLWCILGLLWCITIIGIPVGIQCFKFAKLGFMPFGSDVKYGGGLGSLLVNIIWILFGGIEMSIGYLVTGLFFCCTIIGIPVGIQCFKFAKLALMPFGAKVK